MSLVEIWDSKDIAAFFVGVGLGEGEGLSGVMMWEVIVWDGEMRNDSCRG
jgi:hypothetical protein